jgi:hypothetical protein
MFIHLKKLSIFCHRGGAVPQQSRDASNYTGGQKLVTELGETEIPVDHDFPCGYKEKFM